MKEAFDKEVDSLLRRRVRAGAEARGDGGRAAHAAAHLDADELSAFAEGALPPSARLAAVSHLAGCDECRVKIMSNTPMTWTSPPNFRPLFIIRILIFA